MRMLALGLVVAISTSVDAQCFSRGRRVQCVRQVQQVKQVIQTVPVQTLFLVAPPSYYGVPEYTPPRPVSKSDLNSTLELIVKGIANLDERIQALEANGNGGNGETQNLVTQHCGKCHTGAEAKGGFALSDLSDPATKITAMRLVDSGKMPCGPDGQDITLDPATRADLVRAIRDL